MLGRKKRKVSERTTEIIPKKKGMDSLDKFFIASAVALGSVLAIGVAKNIADVPKNMEVEEHTIADGPKNAEREEENGLEKFAGMKQDELDKAMLKAAKNGKPGEIELLIRAGANMDTRTGFGWTPLMMASQDIMSDDVALLLISSNANLDAKNDMGMTALMIAAMYGRTSVVKALLEGGADSGISDNRDRIAYDFAVEQGFNQTAELIKSYE